VVAFWACPNPQQEQFNKSKQMVGKCCTIVQLQHTIAVWQLQQITQQHKNNQKIATKAMTIAAYTHCSWPTAIDVGTIQ